MDCNHNMDLIPDVSEIEKLQADICPVDWARRSVMLASENNCGKSVLCRDGVLQICRILEDIVSGKGLQEDIGLIKELCAYIVSTGGCKMAEKAAGNVLYTLEHYAEEWDLHCRRKRCSALVCKSYYSVYCIPEKCQGCTACLSVCPVGAIKGGKELVCVVDENICIRCGACMEICPHEARGKYGAVKPRLPEEPVKVGSISAPSVHRRRRRSRTEST